MSRTELEQSWARTRIHLGKARALLSCGDDALRMYLEFLDANELQLAMDELEHAASGSSVGSAFWRHLTDAAREMKLPDEAERFGHRSRRPD